MRVVSYICACIVTFNDLCMLLPPSLLHMYWTGVLYVLDWCVVCTGLVCCMYWTGVLYVLDWCVVCTGLVCCMYWTGHTSPIHQPSTYNIPVQFNTPVSMLYEGGGKGVGHCPCTFIKRGRVVVRSTRHHAVHHPQNF